MSPNPIHKSKIRRLPLLLVTKSLDQVFDIVLSDSDPLNCSLPGSSIHGDSPGKNTGGAMPSSRGSSQPRSQTQVSCTADRFFTVWAKPILSSWRSDLISFSPYTLDASTEPLRMHSRNVSWLQVLTFMLKHYRHSFRRLETKESFLL